MRAYPNDTLIVPEETLETRMKELEEKKLELRGYHNEFLKKTENLRESIKSLENIISEEIRAKCQTVIVGELKAEFIPVVKFRLKKEKKDEQ